MITIYSFFFIATILTFSAGNFFLNILYKKEKNYKFSLSEEGIIGLIFVSFISLFLNFFLKIDQLVASILFIFPLILLIRLYKTKEIDFFTPDPDKTNNIWYARDVDELSKHLGSEPILVIAKSFSPQIEYIDPLPINTLNIPNNHKQYAITWFSLAFIWLGMGVFFIYRTSASRGQKT